MHFSMCDALFFATNLLRGRIQAMTTITTLRSTVRLKAWEADNCLRAPTHITRMDNNASHRVTRAKSSIVAYWCHAKGTPWGSILSEKQVVSGEWVPLFHRASSAQLVLTHQKPWAPWMAREVSTAEKSSPSQALPERSARWKHRLSNG